MGHSHSLTACLVHCTTGHVPIGAFCSRFFPKEPTACRCGFPMETMSHVTHPVPVPVSPTGVGSQKTTALHVAAQIFRGKQDHVCVWHSLVQYRLGVVLCVGLSGYRVCPASLSLLDNWWTCPLFAVVHHGGGPTYWHNLIFTSL
jgi:hypothetical protein